MDKRLQDIKIVVDHPKRESEEIFVLRAVQFIEILKKPSYLILRFESEIISKKELIIPIIPYMKVIIE